MECWSDGISGLDPYTPGEQPQGRRYIKLNTNENPYSPSPRVLDAIRNTVDGSLRLYPDPRGDILRNAVGRLHGLSKDWVFVGNGSDEILAFAFAAYFKHGMERVLYPDISYGFYPVYAKFFNIPVMTIPLDKNFRLPADDFMQPNAGVLIANPNAPTGIFLPANDLRPLIRYNAAAGRVVLIDEAYIDFGGESVIPLVKEFSNLLVVRTLSKSNSLAGLRVGYALGRPDLLTALECVKSSINSYTLDRLALVGAVAALEDESYFNHTCSRIVHTRERIRKDLIALGFYVLPSAANFLFATHPGKKADDLFNELRQNGILVRHFNKPRIADYLRISIGTDKDMDVLIAQLKVLLSG